jgi:hypothetical protein
MGILMKYLVLKSDGDAEEGSDPESEENKQPNDYHSTSYALFSFVFSSLQVPQL